MKKINIKDCLIFAVIILLQVATYLYWGNIKTNLFVDELFSLATARGYTEISYNPTYFPNSAAFKENEWTKVEEYKKFITVNNEEEITNIPFSTKLKLMVKNNLSDGLLNLAYSIEPQEKNDKWPSIILNTVFMIIIDAIIVLLLNKLNVSKWITYLGLIQFGMCAYIIGLVEYIRFYMCALLFMIIVIYMHSIIWKTNNIWKIIICEIISFMCIYLTKKMTPFSTIFAVLFMGCFWVFSLIYKKWKTVCSYLFFVISGIGYVVLYTDYLYVVFNLEEYANNGDYWYKKLSNNILDFNIKEAFKNLIWQRQVIGENYFANISICAMFESIVIILFISVIYDAINNKRKIKINENTGFGLILVTSSLAYAVFFTLINILEPRYYIFAFCSLAICSWIIMDNLLKIQDLSKPIPRAIVILLLLITLISAFAPFKNRNITHLYLEDKEFIENLKKYEEYDVLLAIERNEGEDTNSCGLRAIYECVYLLENDRTICPAATYSFNASETELPQAFILWNSTMQDIEPIMEQIRSLGYQYEYIGTSHEAVANLMYK